MLGTAHVQSASREGANGDATDTRTKEATSRNNDSLGTSARARQNRQKGRRSKFRVHTLVLSSSHCSHCSMPVVQGAPRGRHSVPACDIFHESHTNRFISLLSAKADCISNSGYAVILLWKPGKALPNSVYSCPRCMHARRYRLRWWLSPGQKRGARILAVKLRRGP